MRPMPLSTADERLRDETLLAWCMSELAHWVANPPTPRQFFDGFTDIYERNGSVLLFVFNGEQVRYIKRPDYLDVERADLYLRFFRHLIRFYGLRIKATIAMQMHDGPADYPSLPVFAFQKPDGDRSVLLPDVDFLSSHLYAAADLHDPIDFAEKRTSAVFAGVTSGAGQLTRAKIEAGGLPRLNAALFFRDKPDVDFRLPVVVQSDEPEVVDMIRDMDVGVGQRLSWREQLEHKCLLSMDGNGATCSRVVLSLFSNSVLLKYDSTSQLYYFKGLRPWTEYVPIHDHADVCSVLAWERAAPGSLDSIARRGRHFADLFLSADPVCRYAATLLRLYAQTFEGARQIESAPTLSRGEPILRVMAHVQDRGDLWAWPGDTVGEPGSGLRIERVRVHLDRGAHGGTVQVRGYDAEGVATGWVEDPASCCLPDPTQALHGLAVRLGGVLAGRLTSEVQATFIDGSSAGPVTDGEACRSPTGAPLESLTVLIRPRL